MLTATLSEHISDKYKWQLTKETKMEDNIQLKGHINLKLFNSEGVLKDERDVDNLVVTVGKNYLAAWLAAASQAGKFMSWIGLGTGLTAEGVGQTDLVTPLATRVQGTLTSSTNTWQSVATFGAGVNTGAITEAGLFSVDWVSPTPAGTMFSRKLFGTLTKDAGDSVVFTWTVSFS